MAGPQRGSGRQGKEGGDLLPLSLSPSLSVSLYLSLFFSLSLSLPFPLSEESFSRLTAPEPQSHISDLAGT